MSPSIDIVQHDHAPVVRVQSPRLAADLYPSPSSFIAAAEHSGRKRLLLDQIAAWEQQGFCPEDAAVLACVAPAHAAHHTLLVPSSPLLNAEAFPRLVDHHVNRRPGMEFGKLTNPRPGIYPIVDNLAQLEALMAAGVKIIQLRMKSEACTPEIANAIYKAVELSRQFSHCQLFINDHWQVAIQAGAYGVHLGQEDLLTADLNAIAQNGLRLGVSSHAFWEVTRALTIAPSYVACGPLFPTRAKKMPWIPQGIDNLRYWTRLIPAPVIGIGGVNEGNLGDIHATGCASASIIQAIVSSADPAAEFQRLQAMWTRREVAPAAESLPAAIQGNPLVMAKPTLKN